MTKVKTVICELCREPISEGPKVGWLYEDQCILMCSPCSETPIRKRVEILTAHGVIVEKVPTKKADAVITGAELKQVAPPKKTRKRPIKRDDITVPQAEQLLAREMIAFIRENHALGPAAPADLAVSLGERCRLNVNGSHVVHLMTELHSSGMIEGGLQAGMVTGVRLIESRASELAVLTFVSNYHATNRTLLIGA